MKIKTIAAILPLALLLSACQNVEPVIKDLGTRTSPCIEGAPDQVAQKFYELQMTSRVQGLLSTEQLAQYRPYLTDGLYQMLATAGQQNKLLDPAKGDIFSSNPAGLTSADVSSASTIPNHDAKHIPLRVQLTYRKDDKTEVRWKDEVLMVREGTCWAVADVRYLGQRAAADSGTLQQMLENL